MDSFDNELFVHIYKQIMQGSHRYYL